MLRPRPEGTRSEHLDASYRHSRGRAHAVLLAGRLRGARRVREQRRCEPDQGRRREGGSAAAGDGEHALRQVRLPHHQGQGRLPHPQPGQGGLRQRGRGRGQAGQPDAADDRREGRRHPARRGGLARDRRRGEEGQGRGHPGHRLRPARRGPDRRVHLLRQRARRRGAGPLPAGRPGFEPRHLLQDRHDERVAHRPNAKQFKQARWPS